MTTIVEYGGEHFDAWGSVTWGYEYGVAPQRRFVTVSAATADALRPKLGTASRLSITSDAGVVSAEGVYLLEVLAGHDHRTAVLRLEDRRWLWRRQFHSFWFNVRKRTGEYRLNVNRKAPLELGVPVPDVFFHAWSLRDNVAVWTLQEIVEHVLEAVEPGNWEILADLAEREKRVENLDIEGTGGNAIARVLSFAPGLEVRIDHDDKLRVYDTLDGGEAEQVALARPFDDRRGDIVYVHREHLRPSKVHVLIEREVELKFVGEMERTSTSERGREPLWMEPVIPLPDKYLTISGRDKPVIGGTYLHFDDFLDAIKGTQSTGLPPLTHLRLRKAMAGGFASLRRLGYGYDERARVDEVWGTRLAAIAQHYRRTWRILPAWKDRLHSIRAYRVAVLDYENSVKAPAECFCDYTIRHTTHGYHRQRAAGMFWGRAGFIVLGYSDDLSDARPAPVRVDVTDEDNGIVHLTPRKDLFGEKAAVILGVASEINMVEPAPDRPLVWDRIMVKKRWKCAVVLTCTPAAPNDLRRFHRRTVKPREVEKVLGRPLGECKGPAWTIRIGSAGGWWTARYAWDDDRDTEIRGAFYGDNDYPEDLLTNREQVDAMAVAAAAQVYQPLANRFEGQATMPLRPGLKLAGSIGSLTHHVATSGRAYTRMVAAPVFAVQPVWDLLPDSVRQQLLRQVQV